VICDLRSVICDLRIMRYLQSAANAARPLLIVFVLGAWSQVAQALLIRESLVVFYGNEVSLGAFYGSWLLWLAVGSAAALGWEARRGEDRDRAVAGALRLILCTLPLVLILQLLALRSVRWLLAVSAGEFVPLGDLFLTLTLVNLPGGLLLGLAFPLVCRLLGQGGAGAGAGALRPVARTYAADALGALAGGVLFTFVLIRWQGPVPTLGLTAVALALTALALRPTSPVRPVSPACRRGSSTAYIGFPGSCSSPGCC
jgi:hypothetical protein